MMTHVRLITRIPLIEVMAPLGVSVDRIAFVLRRAEKHTRSWEQMFFFPDLCVSDDELSDFFSESSSEQLIRLSTAAVPYCHIQETHELHYHFQ